MTHRGGDKSPYWGEKFKFCRGNAQKIIFRVVAEHFWRQDVVCGELAMDLDEYNLWNRVLAGELLNTLSPVELVKMSKNSGTPEKTGSLFICMAKCTQRSMDGRLDAFEKGGRSQDTKEGLQQLLNKPEELEIYVRHRFRETAEQTGRSGKAAVGPEAIQQLVGEMSQRLGVPKDTFGDVGQMFWRFEVSGEKLLYEEETVRLVMYMLRQYRDAVSPQKGGAVQLSGGIRYMNVADKYNVSKELGRGGQGVVYLATDKANNGQEVVVKMYGKTNQKEAQESITQEFELLMELKHPKIARVFEIFQDWENVYIVQEPYFGGDLTTAVTKAHTAGVRVDERWLAGVSHQVLAGVEFLHNNGVVHSDLKEANVMVAGREAWHAPQVIVIDFGLANKFSAKSGVGGTPGYMPPEVWNHGLWTPRGDVFSVGAMIFTLRNGKHPFYPPGSPGLEEIAELTKTAQPDTMGSPPLQRLIRAMLEKNFLARPTSSQLLHEEWFASGATEDIDTHALSDIMQRQRKTELYRALLTDISEEVAEPRAAAGAQRPLHDPGHQQRREDHRRRGPRGPQRPVDPRGRGSPRRLPAAAGRAGGALLRRVHGRADGVAGRGRGEDAAQDLRRGGRAAPGLARRRGDRGAGQAPRGEAPARRPPGLVADGGDGPRQGRQGDVPGVLPRPAGGEARAPGRQAHHHEGWQVRGGASGAVLVQLLQHVGDLLRPGRGPRHGRRPDRPEARLLAAGGGALPAAAGAAAQGPAGGLLPGPGEVLMWSQTFHTWIPCRVAEVDPGTGAVQVDQKPGYWFRGHELETRLKHHSDHSTPSPAAKAAGLGRALFEGAVGGLSAADRPGGAGGRAHAGPGAGLAVYGS
ncbi:unnamed protein product [Prorocentrum cordatum]|uniref:Protein kinase domain-containing protein n=1 Tax=Prorocentrum cordatum TaxID=2364126 RepID=A0ABN9T5H7_9DINO|nr:unnamed protein product [Polarella glacialis]